VAETSSFSRAAERIFLTQPAVSKRIARSKRASHTCFDRIGRTVQLTPAGLALLTRSRAIMRELDDVKRSIANLAGTIAGELSLRPVITSGCTGSPVHSSSSRQLSGCASRPAFHGFGKGRAARWAQGEIELAIVTLPRW